MNMHIDQLLQLARSQLAPVVDQPQLEAEVLLAYVLNKPRSFLYAWPEHCSSVEQVTEYRTLLARRCSREPLAYLTGTREFWSLDLKVTFDTLIPRQETEILVESVLARYPGGRPIKAADLGTGSGAIAMALAYERPSWQIHASDLSHAALAVARENARDLKLTNLVFHQGSWCSALPCDDFDIIVSNPPYIAQNEWAAYAEGLHFEPHAALLAGEDGLEAIRDIIHSADQYLHPSGFILIEHGFLQGEAVRQLFEKAGYTGVHSVRDLAGQERVTMAKRAA